jgi:hypothetical protein
MIVYFGFASVTFLVVLDALFRDSTTPNNSVEAWVFAIFAALNWPFTLPFILRQKIFKIYADIKSRTNIA